MICIASAFALILLFDALGVGGTPRDGWPRAGASQATPGHPASAALDKRRGGWWAARDAKTPQWLVVDLGEVFRLTSVRQRFAMPAAWKFRIEGSDSGATGSDSEWTVLSRHDAGAAQQQFIDPVQGVYRYIRLVVTGGGIASSAELQVTGVPLVSDARPDRAGPNPGGVAVMVESCDLWSSRRMWQSLVHAPASWRPVLGQYDEAYDSVTDAHIEQATAHRISGFQSCWFREKGNAGQPVMAEYDGLIQSLAWSAPLRGRVRWSLFWDNANPAGDGIAGADDFIRNIAPFWIAAYLTRPNYLTLDGRPVVAIASAAEFAHQAGGVEAGRAALLAFRAQAFRARLPGLVLLAANSGDARADNAIARQLGFDAVMAYATPIYTGLLRSFAPTDEAVMQAERNSWAAWELHSQLPCTLTASVGYDQRPWGQGPVHYMLTPEHWREIVRQALVAASRMAPGSIGRRLVYLDNWNEFGEGHFIEPTVGFGDAYLRGLLP